MTEAVKVRRQRRAITSTGSSPQPMFSPVPIRPDHPAADAVKIETILTNLLHERADIVRRGDFKILGRIGRMETPRGVIQFPHDSGPVIAFVIERNDSGEAVRVSETEIVIVNAWQGLPNVRINTDKPCQECLAHCDVCVSNGESTGRKTCERCGGRKKIAGPSVACDADGCTEKAGRFNPECTKCFGSGMIVPLVDCPGCEGKGDQICPQCRGAKMYATGNQGGATDWRSPTCQHCRGTRFEGSEVQQIEADYTNWTGENNLRAIGPITRFVVEPVGGAGIPPRMFDVDQDTGGNYMTLVLDSQQRTCITGGILRSSSRR